MSSSGVSSVRASRTAQREAARTACTYPRENLPAFVEAGAPSSAGAGSNTLNDGSNDDLDNVQSRPFCAEDDASLSFSQHMVAGAAAGITEHIVMYPVDTVKTRMQSYVGVRDYAHRRMMDAARAIVQERGVHALWRGVGAVAVSAGPAHALYFATYEWCRKWMGDRNPYVSTSVAGIAATVVMDGIMTPWDVVKQRMQLAANASYTSVSSCMRRVYLDHGAGAFFAGFRATLLMNVPFTATYFCAYESAKKFILDAQNVSEQHFSPSAHCLAGAFAGGLAAAVTTPLDVVKTRLQTQGEIGARRYRGLADALNSIRLEEGYKGLLRGIRPRMVFHMPAAAVCWTTYEFCKHVMSSNAHAEK